VMSPKVMFVHCALALGLSVAGCGPAAEEVCASVHEATCPSDFPRANPDFAYDYKSPGDDETDCIKSLNGPCASELEEYIECLERDPVCCQEEGPDGFQCTNTSCTQEAYGACVAAQYRQ
jgi:hypothetical protein